MNVGSAARDARDMEGLRISPLCALTVNELWGLLTQGRATSEQIVRAYLDSAEKQDPALNAYLELFAEEALEQARQSDARRAVGRPLGALDGVPIALKDNILVAGKRCTCASRMLERFVAPYDATVVQRLRAAGMPLLGKLNMDEFAMGGSNETSYFGVVRNPWALDRVPGGSSGGAAAAVAAGMAPVALGSDTGGSIRQPASFCGVCGVKPAYGAVSRYGLIALASSLDQIGPIGKTLGDCAMALNVIAGRDARDATTDGGLPTRFPIEAADGLRAPNGEPFTLGLVKQCFDGALQDKVAEKAYAAAKRFEEMGARLVQVDMPSLSAALAAYYIINCAEASSNLARYDGVRYGHRALDSRDLDELYRKSRGEAFGAEVRRRVLLGSYALSGGYHERYYLRAQRARDALRADFDAAFARCDALLSPVAPTLPYRLGEKNRDPVAMYRGDAYTVPASLAGLPALSMPCGACVEDGQPLPVGLSLTAPRGALPWLLGVAMRWEKEARVNVGLRPYERATKGEETMPHA